MKGLAPRIELIAVATIVTAIGVAMFVLALMIPEPLASVGVGPREFPYGIAILITACGVLLLLEAIRKGWDCEATDPEAPKADLWPMLVLAAGMSANLALIQTTGFIIATTVMFVFTAKAFGARRLWLAALIGFALAFACYFGFARLLDLRIGGGWIEDYL